MKRSHLRSSSYKCIYRLSIATGKIYINCDGWNRNGLIYIYIYIYIDYLLLLVNCDDWNRNGLIYVFIGYNNRERSSTNRWGEQRINRPGSERTTADVSMDTASYGIGMYIKSHG